MDRVPVKTNQRHDAESLTGARKTFGSTFPWLQWCSSTVKKCAQGYKVLAERRGGKYMAALSCASRNRTPRWSLFWVSNKTTKQETGINTVYSQKPDSWLEREKKKTNKTNPTQGVYIMLMVHFTKFFRNCISQLNTILKKNKTCALHTGVRTHRHV